MRILPYRKKRVKLPIKSLQRKTKRYILWVTKHDGPEDGYGSMWWGWSQNRTMSYEEALKKKEELLKHFYDVNIMEYDEIVKDNK